MSDDRWLREARKSVVLARTRKHPLGIESWLMALDDEGTRLTSLLAEKDATIQRVRDLHRPRDEQCITGAECLREVCEHENECPTEPVPTCVACRELAEIGNPYYGEDGIAEIAYPCETIRALDGQEGQ